MSDQQMMALQKILKGEYVGVDSYQKFLNRLHDNEIRRDLERHEQDLRDMITELTSHLRDQYNFAPEGPGWMGMMADIQSKMQTIGNPDDQKIIDHIYDGVKMGIDQTEQELAKLQGESRKIVEKHLERNKRILEEVDRYRLRVGV